MGFSKISHVGIMLLGTLLMISAAGQYPAMARADSACDPNAAYLRAGSDAGEPNGISDHPTLSADGRFVAFESDASNLTPGDSNNATDAFVFDRVHCKTSRV